MICIYWFKRLIYQNFIQKCFKRGTESIMKYLRNHLNDVQLAALENNSDSNKDNMLKSDIVKATKVFDLGYLFFIYCRATIKFI
jgi:hypothetical protein